MLHRLPPANVESCRQELASLGLILQRSDEPGIVFELVEKKNPARIMESFQGDMWTELECAQAAVRFARYFLSESLSLQGLDDSSL